MVVKTAQHLKTEDRVIETVAWELNIPASRINPYTDFIEDLYLDNIDRELLIARLEKDFEVVLSLEEVNSIETIQDATHYIQLHAVA